MASEVFYRKFRPQTFAATLGQEHVTHTLLNALANDRISHAYLFCGPRGTGKTTTARMVAKAVNCLTNGKGEPCNECSMCKAIMAGNCMDVIEVDAASNTGVDDIRSLREKVNFSPAEARRKVYIIDEVHMLSTSASNALLKTLEEPPPHVVFILATTEVHKLLPTILSRCQRFDFHRLTRTDIVNEIDYICEQEGVTAEPEAKQLVARAATGSMRDALNLFQQLYTYYGSNITLRHVQDLLGMSGDQRARQLVKQLIDRDVAAGVATVNAVRNDGLDLRQFNHDIVDYLRTLMLVKTGAADSIELAADELAETRELAALATLPGILRAVKVFGALDSQLDTFSTLPLELAIVDSAMPEPAVIAAPVSGAAPEPERKPASTKAEPVPAPKEREKTAAAPVSPAPAAGSNAGPGNGSRPQAAPDSTPAPAAQREPAKTPEPPPAAITSTIEQLQAQWNQIINEAPGGLGKSIAAALLRSARPLSINQDTIVVAVKFSYHKEKMATLDNQKIADKIVSSFLGKSCKVQCVYEHENNHLVKAALEMGGQEIEPEEEL